MVIHAYPSQVSEIVAAKNYKGQKIVEMDYIVLTDVKTGMGGCSFRVEKSPSYYGEDKVEVVNAMADGKIYYPSEDGAFNIPKTPNISDKFEVFINYNVGSIKLDKKQTFSVTPVQLEMTSKSFFKKIDIELSANEDECTKIIELGVKEYGKLYPATDGKVVASRFSNLPIDETVTLTPYVKYRLPDGSVYEFFGREEVLKTQRPSFSYIENITQTKMSFSNLRTFADSQPNPTQIGVLINGTYYPADDNGNLCIENLFPGRRYYVIPYALYGGEEYQDKQREKWTKSLSLAISGEAGPTSFTAEGSWIEGDAKIDAYGFATGIDVAALTNQRRYTMGGLDPETTTKIAFGVTGPWGAEWTDREFTTPALTWETPGATATSLSSARMMVETNCDAETGTGFEWRRIDAPELVPSTQAPCPVVDGRLVGSLRNLNPETYYKFRPYYTSASGKTYYGEWTGLFTGDANVYFEPEVRTFAESLTDKRTVRLAGYALAGSDDITEQGFQYRAVGKEQTKARAAEAWQSVAAKGIKMEATLDDLAYGTTYRYRAYAVTAKGTFYGDEREFSTEAESGIEEVINDTEEGLTVALRENPATGTAWVRIAGSDAAEVRYHLTSVSGATVATGTLAADGTWQPVELTVPAGLYLLTVNDATAARTVRLVVR